MFRHCSSFNQHVRSPTGHKPHEYQKYEEKLYRLTHCGKAFKHCQFIRKHKSVHTGNPVNANNVEKPSGIVTTFRSTSELTLESSPIDVSTVGKPSVGSVTVTFMKELTLERNCMNVSNVGKPSVVPDLFKVTRGHTLEKSLMDVKNVIKLSSLVQIPFKNRKEVTQERSLINVRNGKPSVVPITLDVMKRHTVEKSYIMQGMWQSPQFFLVLSKS